MLDVFWRSAGWTSLYCYNRCDASHAVAQQLALRGFDVVAAEMSGLLDTPDSVILEHARVNGRVVVTFDSLHSRGVSHAGIAYFPNVPIDVGVLVETLHLLDAVFEHDDFENWLEYLSGREPLFTFL